MRKAFFCFAVVAICGLFLASYLGAAGGPAIVIKNDGLCGMAGSDVDGNMIFGGVGQVTTMVENGNKVTLKCKGEDITNDSGRGQNFQDFSCGVQVPSGGFVVTTDSHATVSAAKIGTLDCTYKK
jgi:hypothetical protein